MEQETINILIPVISAAFTLIVGFLTWWSNERRKRIYDEYKRKEKKYSELIRSLKGFYIGSYNKELIKEFLNQLNLCWMYCPDKVIRKAYNFLTKVHTAQKYSDMEKEKAMGEFIVSIREDLINRKPLKESKLKAEDFKHLKVT